MCIMERLGGGATTDGKDKSAAMEEGCVSYQYLFLPSFFLI